MPWLAQGMHKATFSIKGDTVQMIFGLRSYNLDRAGLKFLTENL